eukprot:TRINITY_DN2841_c0_g1_i1.p1 TRINITY_DN2841_c0_g1~~TRINITY_DN2841_c0_g1_i1.p1  ORF type:complete len:4290 (+),score=1351.18 TRINITY_DN2841_c0_g1_i1:81-12872(+)
MEQALWRSSPYCGLLCAPFTAGTPLAGGHPGSALQAITAAFRRITDPENGPARDLLADGGLTDAEKGAIGPTTELLDAAFEVAMGLAQADKPEKVLPVVDKVCAAIAGLSEGELYVVPAGWVGMTAAGWLLYVIARRGRGYVVTVANAGGGLRYHPAMGGAPRIKHRTCITIPRVPQHRIADPAFWLVSFLLITKDPPSEYSRVEVVYDVLLPWLAEVTVDHDDTAGRPMPTGKAPRGGDGRMAAALAAALQASTPHTAAGGGSAFGDALRQTLAAGGGAPPQGAPSGGSLGDALLAVLREAAPPDPSDALLAALREVAPPGGAAAPAPAPACIPGTRLRTLGEALREGAVDPVAQWRSPSVGGSEHFKSVWEGTRYVLGLKGVSPPSLKVLSHALRRELLCLACSDLLNSLPPRHPLISTARDRHAVPHRPPTLRDLSEALQRARVSFIGPRGEGTVTPATVAGPGREVVAVFVGGQWCPGCRAFSERLRTLYEGGLRDRGLSVVFVSADKSESEFGDYHGAMPWPAVPFALGQPLCKGLGIRSLPTVLLFDASDGLLITRDGTGALLRHSATFPWPGDRSMLRRQVGDDDARLISMGAEQLTHKALKEHAQGRLTDTGLGRVHGFVETVLRCVDAARHPDGTELPTPDPAADLCIAPPELRGDDDPYPEFRLENGAVVTSGPLGGFSLFGTKDVRRFLGTKLDQGPPEATNLLEVAVRAGTADEAFTAIETCERLCQQLHNRARESTTSNRIVLHLQIIASVGDLFSTVIPLPLPSTDPAPCLWRAGFTGGVEKQKACLEKLHKLALLYASVWQSVEAPTRAFDSERCVVATAILCVFDCVVRMTHGDADTLLLSSMLGEDGGYRIFNGLCIDGRPYEKVAARLELTRPSFARTLAGTVAYFRGGERGPTGAPRSPIFDLRMPDKIELRKYGETCLFLRNLLQRAGLPLIPEPPPPLPPSEMEALMNWLCEPHTQLAAQHPEFLWMRDMAALYRFMATMETRDTELLRRRKDIVHQYWRLSFDDNLGKRGMWMGARGVPGLMWEVGGVRGADLDIADITVTAFNGRELRWGEGPVINSPCDVDRILGQEHMTEDDVLHTPKLPTYSDTLSKEEAELLMTVLTTRYLAIPLVLDFFASMDRHTYLFNPGMQDLLRSVLFEPGPWAPGGDAPEIPHVPLRQTAGQRQEAAVSAAYDVRFKDFNESLLGTPHGLLLNELRHAPHAVLQPVLKVLAVSLKDLGACSVYSANANYICFILDLALDLHTFVEEALAGGASLREEQREELARGAQGLRETLSGPFSEILDGWRQEAEKVHDMSSASVAHAFLALTAQCEPDDTVRTRRMVSSLAYVRNWHGFGLGRNRSDILASSDEGSSGGGLSPEQRLLRFLQAQGIPTEHLTKSSLEKYISTGGRNRPLFLHIGRECVRVPTLIRTSAAELTEGGAHAVRLPPWDLPEAKLLALLQAHRRPIVAFLDGAAPEARDAVLNEVIRTALRAPDFANVGWEGSAGSGSRFAARSAELQIDAQGCEVLWRNDDLKPVPDSMTQFPDFETIFGKEALHCGLVQRSSHRHWVHVVGTEYDLAEWTEPDPAEIGAGCPMPVQTGDQASLALARQLEQQEQQGEQGALARMMGGMGGPMMGVMGGMGSPMMPMMGGPLKRQKKDDEPYVAVEDCMFEGVRYNRLLDPYSDDPPEFPSEDWAIRLVREVLNAVYPKDQDAMKWSFYMPHAALAEGAGEMLLLGCDGAENENLTWKLARVQREPPLFESWMLMSHGRRMFRSLHFSSNARLSLHNLAPNPEKAYPSGLLRHAAGDMKRRRVHGPSLVIMRQSRRLGGREMYLPPMLLQGMLPSCFLEAFHMWLGADDVIRGEPIDAGSAGGSQWFDYSLEVVIAGASAEVRRRGSGYTRIRAGGDAIMQSAEGPPPPQPKPEIHVSEEHLAALRDLSLGFGDGACRLALQKTGNSLERAAAWLLDDANLPAILEAVAFDAGQKQDEAAGGGQADDEMIPRAASDMACRSVGSGGEQGSRKDALAWLPMLVEDGFGERSAAHALRAFGGDMHAARGWLLDEQNADRVAQLEDGMELDSPARARQYSGGDGGEVDTSLDLHCINLLDTADPVLRALAAVFGRLDDLSHVLVWAMPAAEGGGRWKVRVIETPRLRLKLQPQKDEQQVWRLRLLDHPGWFVAPAPPTVAALLRGLPEYAVISNQAGEFRVVVPNHDIVRPSIRGTAFPTRLVPLRTSLGWEEVMEQRFYTYTVHVSGTFLVTPGLGPTLYLVLLRLLARRYTDAFRLVEGVCTDTDLGPDEQWIFDQLDRSSEDLHPDAVACRLRLSLAVLYAPVRPRWELHAEMDRYLRVLPHVSSACTLSHGEELELIRRCSEGTPAIKNRLAYLTKALGREAEQQPPPALVPGQPWLKLFLMGRDFIESHCSRLQRLAYRSPITDKVPVIQDDKLAEWLWSDALLQDDEGGGGKGLGLAFFFHLLRGGVPVRLAGRDLAGSLGELMLRWVHLRSARWGKEALDDGEAEAHLSRHLFQLAMMVRFPDREWPVLPLEDKTSRRELWVGVELYKEPGRRSMARSWADAVDAEFHKCLADPADAGALRAHLDAEVGHFRREPLSLPVTVVTAGSTKRRPPVTDSGCAVRVAPVPSPGGDDEVLGQPLGAVTARHVKMLRAGDVARLYSSLPFEVANHPAAAAPVAQDMLRRLEQDVRRYADAVRGREVPVLLDCGEEDIAEVAAGNTAKIQALLGRLASLICDLGQLQTADAALVAVRVQELVSQANAVPGTQSAGLVERKRFALRRLKRQEAVLDVPYLCALYVSSQGERDLLAANPYAGDADVVLKAVAPVLFHANRVAHASDAKCKAEALRDLITKSLLRHGPESALPRQGSSGLAMPGRQLSGSTEQAQLELRVRQGAGALADLLVQRRWFVEPAAPGARPTFDPRFLLFEFIFSIRLRRRQVEMVRWFVGNIRSGQSRVQQMIMGQGKTTCVAPLLVLLLADGKTLVTQVMPSALLQQTRSVLQSCFAAPILPKKIYTFLFDRSVDDAAEVIVRLHDKLRDASAERGVIVSPPEAIKSFELKFVELLHSIDAAELAALRPTASRRHTKEAQRTRDRLLARSAMADEMISVLRLWQGGALLMDEVDVLLHPLRSELNFPIGNKHAIDLAGPRWDLPLHLIDAIFAVSRGRTVTLEDDQWRAACARIGVEWGAALTAVRESVERGYARDALQGSPHLILLDTEYYHSDMKGPLTAWVCVWIFRNLTKQDTEQLDPRVALAHVSGAARVLPATVSGDTRKVLNLAREWVLSLLPHVLSKINRVGYGLLQEADMVFVDPNTTQSRLLTAVPFVGKDVPSRSSEFAHPDVVIGLTTLGFRYEGLRRSDLRQVVQQLKKDWGRQFGPRDRRPASVLFATWVRIGAEQQSGRADSVPPLPLFHANDTKQFDRLFRLVRRVPELHYYYLQQHVFPATMNFQRLKISACGHELGSSLLFGSRAGFSGTPSNLLPLDLGDCEYEPGSDGDVVHTLTNPAVTTAELKQRWSARGLLQDIARATPPFHALIDTGAYITNMDNHEVASYLLEHLPEWFEGVVFLDKHDRKMVMFRSGRSVPQEQCGVAEARRFTFYDQIHTTGMDIRQAPTARAVLTIGKDMTFRDYAQGAYRMRGIGKGQTLRLFIISEVQTRIDAELGTRRTGRREIDVPAWLLLNSMRMEALQAVKLGEQELQNLWRKHALGGLLDDVTRRATQPAMNRLHRFDPSGSGVPPEEVAWLRKCINEYRETISHAVPDDGEPAPGGAASEFDSRVAQMCKDHASFTRTEQDRERVEKICGLMRHTAAASLQDAKALGFQAEVVHEQEAEQEQEQEAEQEEQKDNRFSRDDEQHNPWAAEVLQKPLDVGAAQQATTTGDSPFYFLSAFRALQEMPTLPFPRELLLTDNFFRPTWLGLGERRLKSAAVLLLWRPTAEEASRTVLVSLAEAETLRWMVHTRQPAVRAAAGLQLLTPSGMIVDATSRAEAPAPELLQCVRFFNGEMYYSEEQLALLERALAAAPLDDRRSFFLHSVRLRQRQQGLYADTPIAQFLTPREQWHLIRARGRAEYFGDHLRRAIARGLDAASAFERHADDQGRCRPQLVQRLLLALSPGFSPGDCRDVVHLLMEGDDDREWDYGDFCEAFGLPRNVVRPAAPADGEMQVDDDDVNFWSCPHCTFINPRVDTVCGACSYGWTGRREPGRDEWVCPPEQGGCSFFNSKLFYYCKVCNRARPDLATIKF